MLRQFLFVVFFLGCLTGAWCQATKIFRKEAYVHASVGVCVKEVTTGKNAIEQNMQQALVPASTIKLVTTATALEVFGPNHCFETSVRYLGKITSDGVLEGDLLVVGGGDPSLGSRYRGEAGASFVQDWIRSVKRAGIRSVKGRVIADAGLFDDEPVSPFWLWEDLGNYYAAGVYGLAVFDNSFQLELKSGEVGTKPQIVSIRPSLPDLTFENYLKAAENDVDSAYIYGVPYQWNRRMFGTIPANREHFFIRGDIPDPPLFLAVLFQNALIREGVSVSDEALSARTMAESEKAGFKTATLLCKTESLPLSQIIRIIHERSDNLYTEYLLRQLALTVSAQPATAREGIRMVCDFWRDKGLDVSALFLYDACGLSPRDRVSAGFLAELLRYMAVKSTNASAFKSSLPLAGKEGSVASFLKGTSLEGKIRLKSGSMQDVRSYAGYYERNGRLYAVVLLVNNAAVGRLEVRKDMAYFLLSL